MTSKTKEVWRILTAGFGVTIAIMCACGDVAMLKMLLSSWIPPVVAALLIAMIISLLLRGAMAWLTGSGKRWINQLCATVAIAPIVLLAMLIVNDSCPAGEPEQMTATVDRVYKETRYKTRRVSRRVYTRGAPYKVNRIDVTLANGNTRSFDISKKLYAVVYKGDTVDIPVNTGLLGLKWLDSGDIRPRHVRPAKKKKGEPRFGVRPGHSTDEVLKRHRERIDSLRRKYHTGD